ncbi:MAG: hypothetical protein H0Z34_08500 [Brevibacillus sp.]|nr:hypothetical protein [Brevibacillus sp.]
MTSKKFSVIGMLILSLAAGCNQSETKQEAEAAYQSVRSQFLSQEGYSFWGVTKLLSGNSANGSAVTFNGQVQGEDVFLDVKLSFPEENRADTLSLLSKSGRLYAKLDGDQAWQKVDDGDVTMWQEMNNWNPITSFEQIEEMRSSVVPLRDPNPGDDIKAVRVLLDSGKLKQSLARQMKSQIGGGVKSLYVPNLKMAMNLSDEEWREVKQGARVQANETRREIDNLIDNMELEAECTLYYDQVTYLPTRMVMQIRSEYDLDGQRMQEYTEVDTFIRNYGQRYRLPQPSDSPDTPARSRSLSKPDENRSDSIINYPGR